MDITLGAIVFIQTITTIFIILILKDNGKK